MNPEQRVHHRHSHMAWFGVAGMAAGAILMVYVPCLKAVSSAMLLFAGFHLAGLLVLFASAYVVGGYKFVARFRSGSQPSVGFNFGWAPAWIHGPWIAALIFAAAAVALQVAAPAYWPLALAAMLLAACSFSGGLITRNTGKSEHAFLPMVDLLSANQQLILDAGCGAGRTTIALARAQRNVRIVALDRFDSSYIEGGSRRLLEDNVRRAGLSERVRIERGDLTALPFVESSFDAAVSAHAVDHLGRQTEKGLREILRVMKPGARLLLVVWVPGWMMFSIANVLSFALASKRTWRRMVTKAGFAISDEGIFNGSWFAVLKKPEA